MEKKWQVAVLDGPASSGKSTVARLVAHELAWRFLDTGAMYRAVTWFFDTTGLDPKDREGVARSLKAISLTVDREGQVLLNGKILGVKELRCSSTEAGVAKVAALSQVRTHLRLIQREIGKKGRLVAEGRDMGSVVFPAAAWKFFLHASLECRAQRRLEEYRQGREISLHQVREELERRDQADQEREDGPLVFAVDAIGLDTTELSLSQVVAKVLNRIRSDPAFPG